MFAEVGGLSDVHVIMPHAVSPGDDVYMRCKYNLDNDQLYTVKWYKGRQEFFRYVPKELPNTKVFPLPGVNVDVSTVHLTRSDCGHGRRPSTFSPTEKTSWVKQC